MRAIRAESPPVVRAESPAVRVGRAGSGKARNLHLHTKYFLVLRGVERVQIQDRYTVQRKHVCLG